MEKSMRVIRVQQLTGITSEIKVVLIPIIQKLTDAKRLTVCLYFMSELPASRHHFRDIADNLDLLNCGYFRNDDFLPMRSTFNAETKSVKSNKISETARLWENIEKYSGKWKNTPLGNQYALKFLEENGILVEHKDYIVNRNIGVITEPNRDYLEKNSAYEIDSHQSVDKNEVLEKYEENLLAHIDRMLDKLAELDFSKLSESNNINFSLEGKPAEVQKVLRSFMDYVKVSEISLQLNINNAGYSVKVTSRIERELEIG